MRGETQATQMAKLTISRQGDDLMFTMGEQNPIKLPMSRTFIDEMGELPAEYELTVPQISSYAAERALQAPGSLFSKSLVFAVARYIEKIFLC